MGIVVAIGGGEIRKSETLKIDKEIIKLSGKKHPKVLFIPTASSDSEGYWNVIQRYYGKKLKCKMDVLFLIKEKPSKKAIKEKISSADIIYVGGGNTLMMMKLWRKLGIDKILMFAYKKGTVLCGISAGSICWFESGHSDSMSFYDPKNWDYINVKGLGLIEGVHCPHYDSHTYNRRRKNDFHKMMKKFGVIGIAIDNNCAITFVDGKYKVINSKKSAGAYTVYKKSGKLISKEIKKSPSYKDLSDLYIK